MNRHERRRLFALGERVGEGKAPFPPEYLAIIEGIVGTYKAFRARFPEAERMRFAMPPEEVMVIVSLDVPGTISRIAKNETADAFLHGLCNGAQRTGDPKHMPTLFMLQIALQFTDAEVERVSLAELGISTGGGNN